MDVVANLSADAQPPEPAQERDGLLGHPAVHAQARTMRRAAADDHRSDPLVPDLAAVLVMVIACGYRKPCHIM